MAGQAGRNANIIAGLTAAQQQQVDMVICNAEIAARASQLKADEDILSEAKEARDSARRLRYIFLLQHRCKIEYSMLSPQYSC
jgi:hypothetical protein